MWKCPSLRPFELYRRARRFFSDTWGLNQSGYYTSQKTKASTQYATMTTRGAMFAADDLHKYQTGEDALANIRSQLARDMARKMNSKLISQIWGLVSAEGAPLAEHVCDVSVCTGDVTVGNTLSPTSVTGAKYLLSERAGDIDAIAIHPDVAAWLETAGMLTYTNVSSTDVAATSIWGSGGIGLSSTQVALFAGLRVVVDEQLPVICNDGGPAQYHCFLFGNGVVKTGQQFPLLIEQERNIASLQDVFAVTYSNLMHVPGTSWSSVYDGPTNEQLRDPSNWELAYCDHRLVPLVDLIVNVDVACLPTSATCG